MPMTAYVVNYDAGVGISHALYTLFVQDVSLVDSGSYTCTAINIYGNASATGSLVVRRQ